MELHRTPVRARFGQSLLSCARLVQEATDGSLGLKSVSDPVDVELLRPLERRLCACNGLLDCGPVLACRGAGRATLLLIGLDERTDINRVGELGLQPIEHRRLDAIDPHLAGVAAAPALSLGGAAAPD